MKSLAVVATVEVKNKVHNVAVGGRTSLNALYDALKTALANRSVNGRSTPKYSAFRTVDVRHSQADISKTMYLLGYNPHCETSNALVCPEYTKV